MTTFKEFPTIEVPAVLVDLGFEDMSWHNDAGPRMVTRSGPMIEFVVGDDATKAECGVRYMVSTWTLLWNGSYSEDAADIPLYAGDDFAAAVAAAEQGILHPAPTFAFTHFPEIIMPPALLALGFTEAARPEHAIPDAVMSRKLDNGTELFFWVGSDETQSFRPHIVALLKDGQEIILYDGDDFADALTAALDLLPTTTITTTER